MAKALPVLYAPSRGCMQVLVDDYYAGEPLLSAQENALFSLARDGLINESGLTPPAAVFGQAPEKNWCWYYQTTELLRADGNWGEIYTLWVDTISKQENLRPTYGPEYLPFIESFARARDWERADRWTIKAGKITKEAKPFLCEAWKTRILPFGKYDDSAAPTWEHVRAELGC